MIIAGKHVELVWMRGQTNLPYLIEESNFFETVHDSVALKEITHIILKFWMGFKREQVARDPVTLTVFVAMLDRFEGHTHVVEPAFS